MTAERLAQFILAALMVIAAAVLMALALNIDRGLVGASVVSALLVIGATILAQDRPQR